MALNALHNSNDGVRSLNTCYNTLTVNYDVQALLIRSIKFCQLSCAIDCNRSMSNALTPYFTIEMPAFISVTTALVLAFILGLCTGALKGETMKGFLNDFRVLTDTLSGIWEAGPKEWTIDSIAETQYRLEGLERSRTYHCKVMALATDGLTSSLFSDELQFTTLSTSGITAAPAALEREAWYDLQGRRVSQPGRGLYIRRTTGADGQTRTEKIIYR